jgi:hypothetical protein
MNFALRLGRLGGRNDDDEAQPVLAPYVRQRSPREVRRLKQSVVGLTVALGAIYGFFVSIFPLAFYLYLAVPIALLVLLVIWVLPHADTIPEQWITRLYFALFIGTFVWPNYLAITLPGLPWITIVRLVALPLCLLILISLSTSPEFRARMWAPFQTSPWIGGLAIALVAIQALTLVMSRHPGDSINRFMNMQFQWTAVLFVSAFVFAKAGRGRLWAILLIAITSLLCLLGFQESREAKVLWAGHIPGFLVVQDPVVQKLLNGSSRFGAYRVQSIFTTSLSFAEFLGLATPFAIYLMQTTRNAVGRGLMIAYLPLSFWVIRATDSRVGAVAFFCSCLLYLLLWAMKNWKKKKQDLTGPAFVLAYPAVVVSFFVLSLFWGRLHDMIWGGEEMQSSNESRKAQYANGIPKILSQPFGHGTGEAGDVLGFTNPAGEITVDTYYLVIGTEYGVLGFLIYFGLVIAAIAQATRYGLRGDSKDAELLLPAAVLLTTFIVTKSVLAQEDTHMLMFLVVGLVAALVHRVRMQLDDTPLTSAKSL